VRGSFDEHEAIFRAIEAGDPEAAETAMRAHVVVQGERFSDLVSSLDAPAAALGARG
jgi:DNA-binding GntR family transcriptional regulator